MFQINYFFNGGLKTLITCLKKSEIFIYDFLNTNSMDIK